MKCNSCLQEPIYGIRWTCADCFTQTPNNNNENKQMYNEYSNSNMISASKVNFKEK